MWFWNWKVMSFVRDKAIYYLKIAEGGHFFFSSERQIVLICGLLYKFHLVIFQLADSKFELERWKKVKFIFYYCYHEVDYDLGARGLFMEARKCRKWNHKYYLNKKKSTSCHGFSRKIQIKSFGYNTKSCVAFKFSHIDCTQTWTKTRPPMLHQAKKAKILINFI